MSPHEQARIPQPTAPPAPGLRRPGVIDPDHPLAESAKFEAFMEILDEAIDGNHRVLVFSSFVSVLKRLRDGLSERSITCC